jgi:hypothetical protein
MSELPTANSEGDCVKRDAREDRKGGDDENLHGRYSNSKTVAGALAVATPNQAAPIESGGPAGVPPSRTKLAIGSKVIEPAPLTAHAKVAPPRVTWEGQKAMVTVALGLKKQYDGESDRP